MTPGRRAWDNEVAYHVFVDRFRRGDPARGVRPGAFRFHETPVAVSDDLRELTGDRTHQHTFHNGDLRGVRDALPYLDDLGVTVLLLSPLHAARSTHRYDPDDHAMLDPHLGDEAEFRSLLDEAHARGMKVILDGVFGHTSYHHAWWQDPAERSRRYQLKPDGSPETWLGWGVLPKLDLDDPDTRERLVMTLGAWRGVDGWRLDAAQHLPASFLRRFRERLQEQDPGAVVIAEEWEFAPSPVREGLYDGILNFAFRRPVIDFFRGEIGAETFVRRQALWLEGYPEWSRPYCFNLLDNHDTERYWGAHAKEPRDLRLALAMQFLLPGTPMLYYGDEIGLKGRDSHRSRGPMRWDPKAWNARIRRLYDEFIRLRKGHPVFARGACRWVHASNRGKFVAWVREDGSERVLVAVNHGAYAHPVSFDGRSIEVPPHDVRIEWA